MTLQGRPACTAARVSCTGISHCHLLPHVPSGFSPQSIAELARNRSTIPRLQLPALRLPGDFASLHPSPQGTYGCSKDCLCDSHSIQTLTDQLLNSQPRVLLLCPLNSFLSLQGHPRWDRTPASVPHPPRAGPVLLTLLFPPTSFTLPSFVWFYIVFSSGQVLLPALSCRSARSPVSEGVFLMYLWREMNSTPTYSSAISFPLI